MGAARRHVTHLGLREFARLLAVLTPFFVLYLVVVPGSIGLRLLTGITAFGGVILYMFINILVINDRRAVRAGYPSGTAENIRNRRTTDSHHEAVLRRNRAASNAVRAGGADRRQPARSTRSSTTERPDMVSTPPPATTAAGSAVPLTAVGVDHRLVGVRPRRAGQGERRRRRRRSAAAAGTTRR